jgi:hypothetical protein
MATHRWFKIECVHFTGDPESKRVKVAALNLLKLPLKIAELPGEVIVFRIVSLRDAFPAHPTTSPLFRKVVFSCCDTVFKGGGFGG